MTSLIAKNVHLARYDTLADRECGSVASCINNPEYRRTPGTFQIVTVGATAGPVTSLGGVQMTPDVTLGELNPHDCAMLVLPGAHTWDSGGNQEFVDAARRWIEAGAPVAGICGATVGLAQSGLLDDRAHTSSAPEQLATTGYRGAQHYVDAAAVTDRYAITAGAESPVEFAREVFARLGIYDDAVLAAWYQFYGEHAPAGCYALVQQQ